MTYRRRRSLLRLREAQAVVGTFARRGSVRAGIATYLDGRRAVRLAFLAGAASNGVVDLLPRTLPGLVELLGVERPDRLAAWLTVGAELGELRSDGGTWRVVGRRTLAMSRGDDLLTSFYRSVGEYYLGPHVDLGRLIREDRGRDDLTRYATTIAGVSRVTEPVLEATLVDIVRSAQPSTWLEVGCGTGVHLLTALRADPVVQVVAVDLAPDVVEVARERVAADGSSDRVEFRVGDALEVVADTESFDVVTLLNNVYYFAESDRPALLTNLASKVRHGGVLLVATQCAPGSIAAAQLDLLLRVQRNASASLPAAGQIEQILRAVPGVREVDARHPLPGEPYVVIVARC